MKVHQQTLFKEYPTYEALLKDLSPDKLLAAFSQIEHIEQSIAKKRVSLEDINELYSKNGKSPGVDYLEEWIRYLAKYIHVKPLIETRAVSFAIYKRYRLLHLADLKLLLEKISNVEYGRDSLFFGCVDAQRLNYCFGMYNEERSRIANKYYQKMEEKFNKIKEETEDAEKQRIYNEVVDIYTGKELWELYQQRCRDEIPAIIKRKWEEFINNESNGSKEE